jgi:P27 family predicted phage terminase small subunit
VGRRGPAPEPREAKIHRGETRPSRLGGLIPTPRQVLPTVPRGLNARAAAIWRRTLREVPRGQIRAADTDLFRAFCEAVALYEESVGMLFGRPLIKGARGGELVRNPLQVVVREHRHAMVILGRELGLSPAARSGLQLEIGAGPSAAWESDIDRELGPTPRALRLVADDV